ncbi:hypothetical protein ACHAWF_018502 [Thalassiosira exigua]
MASRAISTKSGGFFGFLNLERCNVAQSKPEEERQDYIEPKTFREAWDHSDPFQRKQWHWEIRKEFHDMIKRGVWGVIKRRGMPQNRRCVKSNWVFKVKRNGVFCARLAIRKMDRISQTGFQM